MILILVGIVLMLISFSFTATRIEKQLRNIENQNDRIIGILENIRDK